MAELVFFCGTMDSGKSTLALQVDHTRAARGLAGMLFTRRDRAGRGRLSSRLGLERPATEVSDDDDLWQAVVDQRLAGHRTDYLVCDEAQFYTPEQVDQLARVVDELDVDVFAFGITSDFRARLFPGSQRLVELADRVEALQVAALCWCGSRGTHNARTLRGRMVVDGDQVAVGDVTDVADATDVAEATDVVDVRAVTGATDVADVADVTGDGPAGRTGTGASDVAYEVLCRRHFMRRMTASAARAASLSPDVLPWQADQCPIDPHAQLALLSPEGVVGGG